MLKDRPIGASKSGDSSEDISRIIQEMCEEDQKNEEPVSVMVERIERDLFATSNHMDGKYAERGDESKKAVDTTIQEQDEEEDESSASSQSLQ